MSKVQRIVLDTNCLLMSIPRKSELSASNTVYISPQNRYHLIEADPDDNKFVDCAITAKARYIVTQDRHYDVVRFNPKYEFTAVDIDYFLGYLQKSF